MTQEETATGLAAEATALTRLRWARELVAAVEIAREEGLITGARDSEARLLEAIDGCSQQVRAWRAWVKERYIPARARERVLGVALGDDARREHERGVALVKAALSRLDAAVGRFRFDLERTARSGLLGRLVPPITPDGRHVEDLWDPADGSTRPATSRT